MRTTKRQAATRGKRALSGEKRSAAVVPVKTYAWPILTTRDGRPDPPMEKEPNGRPDDRRPHDDRPRSDRPDRRRPQNGNSHIPPPPKSCSGRLHQVREGETVFRLSMQYGVSMEAILAANPQITDPDTLIVGQVVCIPGQDESMLEILNALLTAEKVETALYARGLESPALADLPPEQFAYFQAGLSHEIAHIDVLTDLGASIPFDEFFYPPGTFEDLTIYVNTLLTLETAGVSAYIQASDEFARMGRFDLSRLMDQIMGVEAEHRALLREVLDLIPAANLCFERAPNLPVTEILAALPSFLQPNQFDGASEGPIPLPTREQAERLIGPNGCPNPRPDL